MTTNKKHPAFIQVAHDTIYVFLSGNNHLPIFSTRRGSTVVSRWLQWNRQWLEFAPEQFKSFRWLETALTGPIIPELVCVYANRDATFTLHGTDDVLLKHANRQTCAQWIAGHSEHLEFSRATLLKFPWVAEAMRKANTPPADAPAPVTTPAPADAPETLMEAMAGVPYSLAKSTLRDLVHAGDEIRAHLATFPAFGELSRDQLEKQNAWRNALRSVETARKMLAAARL